MEEFKQDPVLDSLAEDIKTNLDILATKSEEREQCIDRIVWWATWVRQV